jgi:hypothetical protein
MIGRDGIAGVVVLAIAGGLFAATVGIERNPLVPIGPAFYPRIVLGITAAMAALLVVLDVVAVRRMRGAPAAPPPATRPRYGAVLLAFAVFGAYVLALPLLGFRVATLAFMLAMQVAIERPSGRRAWVVAAIVAVGATFASYWIFDVYLQVLLPRGRWTGF